MISREILKELIPVTDEEQAILDGRSTVDSSIYTENDDNIISARKLLKDGKLITHPLDSDILPGITQLNLIRAAEKLGIPCLSQMFSKDEMYSADAVMITSTTKLIKLCTEIDGISTLSPAIDTVKQLFDSLRQELYSKIG